MQLRKSYLFFLLLFSSCSHTIITSGAWLSTPESINSFRKEVDSLNTGAYAAALFKIENMKIVTGNRKIDVRIYYPRSGNLTPVLIYVHGGCWVAGSIESHDQICRYLSKESNVVVIAIDYRLAPEFKYPSAHDDIYEITKWVWKHSSELGIDSSKIAIGGESAGAYFAAATTLRCMDNNGPKIAFQLLIYAALDGGGSSWSACKKLYFENEKDIRTRYGSPLWADNLSGTPPTYNIFGQFEISRSEEELFIRKLAENGTFVKSYMIEGVGHDVENWGKLSGNRNAHRKAVEFIKEGFNR